MAAATIPQALKAADIARFAQRAGQVEKAKPVVAYWCNYWIVEQILSKGLHKADDDSTTYTMNLMDKLEQTKSDFNENDAIVDDMAGQAYIEQFGLETFQRAENAMKANRASRQTADTFQAAATFLDLCQIWGPLEPEVASKIKFAKYHALRIAKAIKAGKDPNLSNPAPEPSPSLQQPPLDPNDPDVQMLNGASSPIQNSTRQPSVVEIPDEHDQVERHLAQSSTHDESLHPSRAPSVPPQPAQNHHPPPQEIGEDYYHSAAAPEVSPLAPSTAGRTLSEGGGYFPPVPEVGNSLSSIMPEAPPEAPGSLPLPLSLPDSSSLSPPSAASAFQPRQQPPTTSLHSFPPPPHVDESNIPASAPAPVVPSASVPSYPSAPPSAPRQAVQTSAQPPAQPPPSTSNARFRQTGPSRPIAPPQISSQGNYLNDEDSVLKAQKHARWAISALNFEDVNTAVKELRGALESLGAR